MKKDIDFIKRTMDIASSGIEEGSGPFGALIVTNGKIISEAVNRVVQTHDPTAHAEILAIRDASFKLKTHDLSDCIIYSSCEPCPMCLGAIYWAGIKKVVYASDRHEAENSGFSDSLIYNELNLDPAERKISFVRLTEAGGSELFRKWDEKPDKIQY
jgi:guanine deaminase